MTRTGKVVLGVGLALGTLGVITYTISEARARTRLPPRTPPLTPPTPPTIPPGARNYIGSGWTNWPHKDVFPDVDAIVQAFRRLGYQVTDSLLSTQSMQEIYHFQADHNLWWVMYGDESLGPEILEYPAEPSSGHLDEDSLVGHDTVEGLYDALLADENFPGGWPALVDWYEARV